MRELTVEKIASGNGRIIFLYRIIPTIGKPIITEDTLAGAGVGIGIDESAQFGIVITGLEVVERGFGVVGLSAIRET